jgi:hypothetical protein
MISNRSQRYFSFFAKILQIISNTRFDYHDRFIFIFDRFVKNNKLLEAISKLSLGQKGIFCCKYIFTEGLHPSLWQDTLSGLISHHGHAKLKILEITTVRENIHEVLPR